MSPSLRRCATTTPIGLCARAVGARLPRRLRLSARRACAAGATQRAGAMHQASGAANERGRRHSDLHNGLLAAFRAASPRGQGLEPRGTCLLTKFAISRAHARLGAAAERNTCPSDGHRDDDEHMRTAAPGIFPKRSPLGLEAALCQKFRAAGGATALPPSRVHARGPTQTDPWARTRAPGSHAGLGRPPGA